MGFEDSYIKIYKKFEKHKTETVWNYGTAGFRGPASSLSELFFKVGIFASLRAIKLQNHIGLMITASHNPPADNGIKIVDSNGGMMAQEAEEFCSQFVNSDCKKICLIASEIIKDDHNNIKPNIIVGYDSRNSSLELLSCLREGIDILSDRVSPINIGLTTTPCLHFSVRFHNEIGWLAENSNEFYLNRILGGYRTARDLIKSELIESPLFIDCANGVASVMFDHKLMRSMKYLRFELRNNNIGDPTCLNVNCGADFVKTKEQRPCGFDDLKNKKCLSFDGDADRVVYFQPNPDGRDLLMDGDRILCLLMKYFKYLVQSAIPDVSIGAVQTAYSNGASSKYIKEVLGVPLFFVPTGVKHLVKKAEELDLGIYFEANGHGSVYFSECLYRKVESIAKTSSNESAVLRARVLLASFNIVNPTIGDAISAVLLVEMALDFFEWTLKDWLAQYEVFPSKLTKVKVKDRLAFVTCDAERRLSSHLELQNIIDRLVESIEGGRCFVRPSGTEDVVRIYAEAKTEHDADKISNIVSNFVTNL